MDLANAVGTDRIKAGGVMLPRLTMRELATLTAVSYTHLVSAASDDFASAQAALAVQADWSATQSTGTSAMVTVAFAPSQGSILQRPATHPLTDELTYPLTYGVA